MIRSFLIALLLILTVINNLQAQISHLSYVKNSRNLDANGKIYDLLQWGRYDFQDNGNCTFIAENYDAKKDLKPSNTGAKHPVYFQGLAQGTFQIATRTSKTSVPGTYTLTNNSLIKIVVGSTTHTWKIDPNDSDLWRPELNTDTIGTKYKEVYGYAMVNDAPVLSSFFRPKDQLASYYSGEEQTLISGAKNWITQPTSWHVDWFTYTFNNNVNGTPIPVIGYKAFDADTRGGLYKFSTFAFNLDNRSYLTFHSDGGYDYNKDKIPDEPKHTLIYQGRLKNNVVDRIVWCQHFYQTNGYPILSTGYYKQ